MPDAAYFRKKARECRALLKIAKVPDVVAQLRVWADEFEEGAKAAEAAARGGREERSQALLDELTDDPLMSAATRDDEGRRREIDQVLQSAERKLRR